ncbi:glycosyltransferase family 2 protein [Sphingosinicella humi]|uniref:Glycosyl transferase family 2 n=1 Tax=Allosphingosinicella humi TaxID=2068657 RepID=A0A2U2J559_9SPHN|nr:glycosyltransferase family 2 protein [Sphingosinicella humi]PWG03421.1 glycosyl transferase family 2 [Sphingosinicella humi]
MASDATAGISIIIPSHNRCALLQRVLDALGRQDFAQQSFEVVVVADGCVDDTLEMLASYRPDFLLRVLEADGVGPAEGRNIGAAAAQGQLLIFLDDDVLPEPEFVAAHVEAHQGESENVVIGPYPPYPYASKSLFRLRVRHWWTKHFEEIARPGHRFSYRDLLTGNLSISAELWRSIGGLDAQFRYAREDYELGVRLMRRGVRFAFAPGALGYHHEHLTMSLEGSFRRAFEEGRSDIRMGRKHPHIKIRLKAWQFRMRSRRLQRLADRGLFMAKHRGDGPATLIARLLGPLERRGLRSAYLMLYSALNRYWYLRGVAEELGSFAAWREFTKGLAAPGVKSEITIDLREGVDAAAEVLDTLRPRCARFRYGHRPIGIMLDEPGSERCRGDHIRRLLAEGWGSRLLAAMAADGAILPSGQVRQARLVKAIEAAGAYYGPPRPADMWMEQYAQWRRLDRRMMRAADRASAREPRQGALADHAYPD